MCTRNIHAQSVDYANHKKL